MGQNSFIAAFITRKQFTSSGSVRFQDNLQAGKFLEDLSGFAPEFMRALKLVEEDSRIEKLAQQQKQRKFEESEKSQKKIKSMIVSDKNDAKKEIKSKKGQKRS